jgi:hypothetical protein
VLTQLYIAGVGEARMPKNSPQARAPKKAILKAVRHLRQNNINLDHIIRKKPSAKRNIFWSTREDVQRH